MATSSSLFDLSGNVAIVTGSSRGIGRAIAERLAQHGAKLVVSSRQLDACEEGVEAIRTQGGEAFGRKEDLQGLVNAAIQKWGGVDTLVCNAAVNPYYGPALDMSDEAYDKVMAANVRSNFWLTNMVLPQMAERGGGSIIIVSSVAGLLGTPVIGVYGRTASHRASCAPTSHALSGRIRRRTRKRSGCILCAASASRTKSPAPQCSLRRRAAPS